MAPTCAEPSFRVSRRFWGNQETNSLAMLLFARICSRPSRSLRAFAYEGAAQRMEASSLAPSATATASSISPATALGKPSRRVADCRSA
jgi:hypothetical protein